jgi:ribonuclease HI
MVILQDIETTPPTNIKELCNSKYVANNISIYINHNMNNIHLLSRIKNNLDYNKHFYETTRELYPDVEICFVSYGSTDGTMNG